MMRQIEMKKIEVVQRWEVLELVQELGVELR